jgi:hypothetical protein
LCEVAKLAIHPQEDLARFGYRSRYETKTFENPFTYLAIGSGMKVKTLKNHSHILAIDPV